MWNLHVESDQRLAQLQTQFHRDQAALAKVKCIRTYVSTHLFDKHKHFE